MGIKIKEGKYINSEYLYESGFYIPSGVGITNQEIERVSRAVLEVLT